MIFWVGAQWFGGVKRGGDGHGESPELCPSERECLLKDDLMARVQDEGDGGSPNLLLPKLMFPSGEGGGLGVSTLEDEAGGGCGGGVAEWGRAHGQVGRGCPRGQQRLEGGSLLREGGGKRAVKVGSGESGRQDLPLPPP